jgi:hypothetical protein
MKRMKPFVKTCYSEYLLTEAEVTGVDENGEATTKPEDVSSVPYLGGLGQKFKYPGDAKKWVP